MRPHSMEVEKLYLCPGGKGNVCAMTVGAEPHWRRMRTSLATKGSLPPCGGSVIFQLFNLEIDYFRKSFGGAYFASSSSLGKSVKK